MSSKRFEHKVEELNTWKLPAGVKVKTFYDRSALIQTTVETVMDILISGMVLVFIILVCVFGPFACGGDCSIDHSGLIAFYLFDDGPDRRVGESHFTRSHRLRHCG